MVRHLKYLVWAAAPSSLALHLHRSDVTSRSLDGVDYRSMGGQSTRRAGGGDTVEEKFTKFSGEPRDARENLWIQPYFWRILSKIVFQMQNWALPKFRILDYETDIRILKSISKIQNQSPQIRSPYSFRIWSRDLKIRILRLRFGRNLVPWIFLPTKILILY